MDIYKGVLKGYMWFYVEFCCGFLEIWILKIVCVILLDFYPSVYCQKLQCVNSYQGLQSMTGVLYTVLG